MHINTTIKSFVHWLRLNKKVLLTVFAVVVLILIGLVVFATFKVVKYSPRSSHKSSVAATSNPEPSAANQATGSAYSSQGSTRWLIAASAVGFINQAEGNSSFTNSVFNQSYDYEISSPNTSDSLVLSQAVKVLSYKSYAQFAANINQHTVPSGYKLLMYDNEDWPYTPLDEQHNPLLYYQKFGQLAHQSGYQVLATPAADLTKVLMPKTDNYSGYLALGLAKTAQYADVFNIQAQNSPTAQAYISFVQSAIAQIKSVNPNATILAGLTVRANGPSLTTLESEYNGTKNMVSGYWLNVISHSASDNNTVGSMAHAFLVAVNY